MAKPGEVVCLCSSESRNMLYAHHYNSKIISQPCALISIKATEQAEKDEAEIHILRSSEPFMCAATVDFYPVHLLRETAKGSRSWFCLGGLQKISIGLKSLTEDGKAIVVVLQKTLGADQQYSLEQRELSLSLDLKEDNGKVEWAIIVDGPILITCTIKGIVQAHSLHAFRGKQQNQTNVLLGYQGDDDTEVQKDILRFYADRVGRIDGRVMVSLFLEHGEAHGSGHYACRSSRTNFFVANLCARLAGITMTTAEVSGFYEEMKLSQQIVGEMPVSADLALSSSKWTLCPDLEPLYVIMVEEYGSLCVTCTEKGAICTRYGDNVVSRKDLPLPVGTSVRGAKVMTGNQHQVTAPQALLVLTCSYISDQATTSSGKSGGSAPFSLVFTLPDLAMIVELRGCDSVQQVTSSSLTQRPLWLCFVAPCITASKSTVKNSGNIVDSKVGPLGLVPVLVTVPCPTRGLNVYRHNGTSCSLMPGTAANLMNIYSSGSISSSSETGKAVKSKSKKKRKIGMAGSEPLSCVQNSSTNMVSSAVSHALQARLSTLQKVIQSLRKACCAKARQLHYIYQSIAAWTGPDETAPALAKKVMTKLSEHHTPLFCDSLPSSSMNISEESKKDAIIAGNDTRASELSLVGKDVGTSGAHAPLVLAGIALPHPASSSLTLLLRVIHPCASDNKTALPFWS